MHTWEWDTVQPCVVHHCQKVSTTSRGGKNALLILRLTELIKGHENIGSLFAEISPYMYILDTFPMI